MTLIKCNNPNCVFHPHGFCVQVQLTIGENGCCDDSLTEKEYKEIVVEEMKSIYRWT